MTIKYTVTAGDDVVREQLEIGKHIFKRDHARQEYGLISEDDDFSEQAADAGFPCDIADKIFDTFDTLILALDLATLSEDMEDCEDE